MPDKLSFSPFSRLKHWGIHVAFLSFRASFSYSLEQKKYNGSWYTLINSSLYTYLIKTNHRLWTPREEIAYTARQKLNPNPKSSGTNEAYFGCHIGPIFQISLIYASIACPQSVRETKTHWTKQEKCLMISTF